METMKRTAWIILVMVLWAASWAFAFSGHGNLLAFYLFTFWKKMPGVSPATKQKGFIRAHCPVTGCSE